MMIAYCAIFVLLVVIVLVFLAYLLILGSGIGTMKI